MLKHEYVNYHIRKHQSTYINKSEHLDSNSTLNYI